MNNEHNYIFLEVVFMFLQFVNSVFFYHENIDLPYCVIKNDDSLFHESEKIVLID